MNLQLERDGVNFTCCEAPSLYFLGFKVLDERLD